MFQIAGSTRTLSGGCRSHDAKSQNNGGARRDRTDDLMLAKHALSQLSYGPKGSSRQAKRPVHGGPGTTRTSDLTLIRGAL